MTLVWMSQHKMAQSDSVALPCPPLVMNSLTCIRPYVTATHFNSDAPLVALVSPRYRIPVKGLV